MNVQQSNAKIKSILSDIQAVRRAYPDRITWIALQSDTGKVEVGVSKTKRTVNDFRRKGWDTYVM